MEKSMVEKKMKKFEAEGYHLISTRGRGMRPAQVYHEIMRNRSQTVVISKEAEVSRQMTIALKEWSRKNSTGMKRKWTIE
jgi:hypothetical protein